MPLLACPFCSATVDVPTSRAGSEIDCPSCQKAFPIPKLGELRKLESDSAASVAKPGSGGAAAGQRVAFALLMTIAAIAVVGASYCMVRFVAIEVPATTEEHIAEVEQLYSEMPASQLVREWQEMEDFSAELANPYFYQMVAEEKSQWLRNALIGFAIAVVSAVIAFVSLSVGRTKS